jgi:cysteine-rich repeat protein
MIRHRGIRLAYSSSLLSLVLVLVPGLAFGQLSRPQQRCVRALNGGLAKVAEAQGRVNTDCVRKGRKGNTSKLGPGGTIESCVTDDLKARVARKQQQTVERESKRCKEPLPSFGATDAATLNAAAKDQELALIHDVFGVNIDAAIVVVGAEGSPETVTSKCQEKIAAQTQKCMDTRLREFNRCKINGLRGSKTQTLYPGADDPFDDAGDLELCMGWDRKSQIGRCRTTLFEKIEVNCECVPRGIAARGACFDVPDPDLADCLDRLTACRSCLAINEGDGLSQDCDVFDDGEANGTCPPVLPSCGDGTLQTPAGEECDDGALQQDPNSPVDGCGNSCEIDPGYVCQGEPSTCVLSCGDGALGPNEDCDDGNLTDGDGCSDNCQTEAGFDCAGAPSTCDTVCGDGLVRGDEECDDANLQDPNAPLQDPNAPLQDPNSPLQDPNSPGGDGCSNSCEIEPGYVCQEQAAFLECPGEPSVCALTCGNGVINIGESCDDGNIEDEDGCSSNCQVESGWVCQGRPSTCVVSCANGVINLSEECDDGNALGGDGCSSTCQVEPGYTCVGEPSTCTPTTTTLPPSTTTLPPTTTTTLPPTTTTLPPTTTTLPPTTTTSTTTTTTTTSTTTTLFIIGDHKCVFDPGSSTVQISTQALPLPPYVATGAIDVVCGGVDPVTGKAPCDCPLQFFDPINIIGIGFICFTPGGPCPTGEIDCDGGNALDVDMDSNHNIGACSSNPDCASQCAGHCGGLAPPHSLFFSGCEGFCLGGARDGLGCTDDSDCPGGSCPGKDLLPHGNICQCDCILVDYLPSGPGGLQCSLSANIDVEINPPCGDGDILIAVGTRCIPLTTELVTSQMHNTNNTPGKDFPTTPINISGSSIPCTTLATSTTTGLTLAGAANFMDSTIGDLTTTQFLVCQ